MTKNINDHTATYKPLFKAWQVKAMGEKPGADLLAHVHGLGLRPGKQALANAMALRAEGVTGAQIVMACGAPQLNRMRGLIADGHVKRQAVPPNAQGHTVYRITLTAKGEARIKRNAEAQATAALKGDAPKPAKAASKRKPAKPAKVPAAPQTAPVPAPAADTANVAVDQHAS